MTTEAGSVVGQRFGAFTFTSQVGKKQNTKTWAKFQSLEWDADIARLCLWMPRPLWQRPVVLRGLPREGLLGGNWEPWRSWKLRKNRPRWRKLPSKWRWLPDKCCCKERKTLHMASTCHFSFRGRFLDIFQDTFLNPAHREQKIFLLKICNLFHIFPMAIWYDILLSFNIAL